MSIPQPTIRPHAEREYLHTFTAGALLPMAQATLMGIVVFIVSWLIARIVFDAIDPHKWAIIPGAIVWVWNLFKLFRHWLSLTTIETVLQKDINGDGVIGKAETQTQPAPKKTVHVQIDRVSEQGHVDVSNMFDLPASYEQLSLLANGLKNNLPFTERVWVRMNKTFTRDEFDDLRDEMLEREMIEYVNDEYPQLGIRFKPYGREVMKTFEAPSPPPPPKA